LSTTVTTQTSPLEAWVRLYRGHAAALRDFNGSLSQEHGLTINDYEALLLLANAPDRRLRPTDLAQTLQLTASGVTRLLEGLEAGGYVERSACPADRRVTYAVLTEAGVEKLRAASRSHVREVEERLGALFDDSELTTLVELLGRLPGALPDRSCTVPR